MDDSGDEKRKLPKTKEKKKVWSRVGGGWGFNLDACPCQQ